MVTFPIQVDIYRAKPLERGTVGNLVGKEFTLFLLRAPLHVPDEANFVKSFFSLVRHAIRKTTDFALLLSSLSLYPDRQLMVSLVPTGDVAMFEFLFELLEFLETFFPNRLVRIPDKPNLFQRLDTFFGDSGTLAFHFKFVLVALAFCPLRQKGVLRIVIRYQAVPVFVTESQQVLEPFRPVFGLVGTKLDLLRWG